MTLHPFKKGHVPWNKGTKGLMAPHWAKGLTKETDERIRRSSERMKQNNPTKSIETRNKISVALKGRPIIPKGYKFSKEIREKMSLSKKGKVSPRKGVKLSEETKRKLSESHKGEKSALWRGGKSFEEYGFEWTWELRRDIRRRDNFICQECGGKDKEKGRYRKLQVHHINYDKKNNDYNNLISLCTRCHRKTTIGNRTHWKQYFQMKMFIRGLFNPENILIFNENNKNLLNIQKIEEKK